MYSYHIYCKHIAIATSFNRVSLSEPTCTYTNESSDAMSYAQKITEIIIFPPKYGWYVQSTVTW